MNLMLERDTPEQCELFDQYGWNAAIECLKNRQNDAYSDVLSSGGLDPRK